MYHRSILAINELLTLMNPTKHIQPCIFISLARILNVSISASIFGTFFAALLNAPESQLDKTLLCASRRSTPTNLSTLHSYCCGQDRTTHAISRQKKHYVSKVTIAPEPACRITRLFPGSAGSHLAARSSSSKFSRRLTPRIARSLWHSDSVPCYVPPCTFPLPFSPSGGWT